MKMSGWISALGVAVFATMVAGCAGEADDDDVDDVEDVDYVDSEVRRRIDCRGTGRGRGAVVNGKRVLLCRNGKWVGPDWW